MPDIQGLWRHGCSSSVHLLGGARAAARRTQSCISCGLRRHADQGAGTGVGLRPATLHLCSRHCLPDPGGRTHGLMCPDSGYLHAVLALGRLPTLREAMVSACRACGVSEPPPPSEFANLLVWAPHNASCRTTHALLVGAADPSQAQTRCTCRSYATAWQCCGKAAAWHL